MPRTRCDSCNLAIINGVVCHETGCPDSWQHTKRTCKWCGTIFAVSAPFQDFCDDSCYRSYNDIPDDEAEAL